MNPSADVYEYSEETVKFIQQLSNTEGKLESPINLNISYMKIVQLKPIQWFNYNITPKKLKLSNTGYTAIVSAKWYTERPYLCGGPFLSNYVFSQFHFHWGETAMNGSEHYVDGGRMPMELHAVHFNSNYDSQETALHRDDGIIILVYLFQLQAASNPLLEEIVKALSFIQTAHSSVRLIPFPITNILRCFQNDYFVYWGSIKMMNYRHSVLWVICRKPIGISSKQIEQFRTLHDEYKIPILTNCRSLSKEDNRNVFYICPGSSRYATLLPVSHNTTDIFIQDKIDHKDA